MGGEFFWPPALALAPGGFFYGTPPPRAKNGPGKCDFGRLLADFVRVFKRVLATRRGFWRCWYVHTFMLITFFPRVWHGVCLQAGDWVTK